MRTVTETFLAFLLQGCTGFGGPVAHIGHFRRGFVERRRWIGDAQFGELLAMCSALPGPTSSQVAFGIGIVRGGIPGGLAAWAGFTLPAAVILGIAGAFLAADGGTARDGAGLAVGAWAVGLKAFAVAVVAHAVHGMGRTFAASAPRAAFAALVAIGAFAAVRLGGAWAAVAQPALIALGAGTGLMLGWRERVAAAGPADRKSVV